MLVGGIEPDGTTPETGTTPDDTTGLLGDVNCDGSVAIADAVLLNRYLAEDSAIAITEQGQRNADCNADTMLNPQDVQMIMQHIANLIDLHAS